MLPWFFRYDHTNYARWGAVCLADATQLLAEILQEFRAGNFVVKQSNAKYNQVDPDQSGMAQCNCKDGVELSG